MDFIGSHILSIDQFERADIDHIFSVARMMEPYAHRHQVTKVLDGAILGNMSLSPAHVLGSVLAVRLICLG